MVCSLIDSFVEGFHVVPIFLGIDVFRGVDSHHFDPKDFLGYLENLIEILKQGFGLSPVAFLDILPIYLYDCREPVDDELLEKGAAVNGVSLRLYIDNFEGGYAFELGDLEQRHDVGLLEVKYFELPK